VNHDCQVYANNPKFAFAVAATPEKPITEKGSLFFSENFNHHEVKIKGFRFAPKFFA